MFSDTTIDNVEFYPDFINSTEIFKTLRDEIKWKQNTIKIRGKEVKSPRLTAWYGEKIYTYSGIRNIPNKWTPALLDLKKEVESKIKQEFNSVLLGLYRNGQDSIAWHSDNEPELGEYIASLSFGETRTFYFKEKKTGRIIPIPLTNGSLLVMSGKTQQNYLHSIPKEKTDLPRINLTFRQILY